MSPPPAIPKNRRHRRRPISWVEVTAAILFLGIVAGIALPRAQEVRERGVAGEALADFDALRRAAMDYRLAHDSWPPDAGPGEVPSGLEPFLSQGTRLTAEEYVLTWEHWRLPSGLPRRPGVQALAGVSMTTGLPRVAEAVGRALGDDGAWYALGDRYTFIIEGL